MIGVAVQSAERDAVAEFFELFKTPWEFYRNDGQYDVLICMQDQLPDLLPALVLLFGSRATAFDSQKQIPVRTRRGQVMIEDDGKQLPIYGEAVTFPTSRYQGLTDVATHESVAFSSESGGSTILRIGYDLFHEVRHLLTTGQPAAHSESATLERHIGLLRKLILKAGLPLVEIPPVTDRHPFMVCLTHDIDHPVLRNHWADHTMFGFLYRATLGTLLNVCRGRKSTGDLVMNWTAALKLPLVYLGMAKDAWGDFDRYLELEAGLGATYFVIPKGDDAGQPLHGHNAARRAARYEIEDVEPQLKKIISSGAEVGLHGIDAWADGSKATAERKRVAEMPGAAASGVRMHWLFFDEKSAAVLDQAGFDYDSTVGYGETVGFRAGTTQAFKPLTVENLLELPLHIMDTALFYPRYLNLSESEAEKKVEKLINETTEAGGALTINWHDRSIAPERLWEDFYLKLLARLKRRGAWFPTATQAVAWFRKRRSATVEAVSVDGGALRIKASVPPDSTLPGVRVRVYKPIARSTTASARPTAPDFIDLTLRDKVEVELKL